MIGLSHAVIVLGILLCLFLLVCVLPILAVRDEDAALSDSWDDLIEDADVAMWEAEVSQR